MSVGACVKCGKNLQESQRTAQGSKCDFGDLQRTTTILIKLYVTIGVLVRALAGQNTQQCW